MYGARVGRSLCVRVRLTISLGPTVQRKRPEETNMRTRPPLDGLQDVDEMTDGRTPHCRTFVAILSVSPQHQLNTPTHGIATPALIPWKAN